MKSGFWMNRREFLYKTGALTAALASGSNLVGQGAGKAGRPLNGSTLEKFVDALPIPTVVPPDELRPSPVDSKVKVPYYRMTMRQAETRLHRDLKPTRFW